MPEPHAETIDLAKRAYEASGCKTYAEFVALFGGAIGKRTLTGWLEGAKASPLAALMLREFIAGWRPTCI